jgi:hypothetical protein
LAERGALKTAHPAAHGRDVGMGDPATNTLPERGIAVTERDAHGSLG